jgi:hypothetical protein
VPSLAFFPGMKLPAASKIACAEHCFDRLQALFDVKSMGEHADAIARRAGLPLKPATFAA